MSASTKNIAELENAPILKLLVRYSLPAIAGVVVYSLYNLIDSVFIGRGVGPDALNGLGVAFPVMMLVFALGTLVGLGGASVSSILLGKKDIDSARRTVCSVASLSIISAIILIIPILIFLEEILIAFGANETILPYAYDFMFVTLLGIPVTYLFFNLNHVMRATGFPHKAMMSTVISAVINLALAPLFIFGFDWGITGAALATVIAQVIGLVRVLLHFSNKSYLVHFQQGLWGLRKRIISGIFSIGMAPCLVNACGCLVTVFINRELAATGDEFALGAFGTINRVLITFAMLVVGLTQGMQPIIGYNHGALKPQRVLQTLKFGIIGGSFLTTLGFLACMIFPRTIAECFTENTNFVNTTVDGLRYACLVFPVVGGQIVIGNFFQAIGKARLSIFISLTRQMIFLLPCVLILPQFLGLTGVWISMPISDLASCLVSIFFIKKFLHYYRLKHRHYFSHSLRSA